MIQAAKEVVADLYAADPIVPDELRLSPDLSFHGPAPVGVLTGAKAAIRDFYAPLAALFYRARRVTHLFLGGVWQGQAWVATAGVFEGALVGGALRVPRQHLRTRPGAPLGWAAQGAVTPHDITVRQLRFGAFYRVEGGTVVEIRTLLDLPGLLAQIGHPVLPRFAGRAQTAPGPRDWNGCCYGPQPGAESARTLALVEAMLGGCNALEGSDLASMGMAAFWHEDMAWHGPWGIGSTYGFRDFQDHAQGPSVASFPNRRGGFHAARIADGVTAAFTGWPSLRGDFTGAPFRGIPPTGGMIGQNIMDFYVRRGDKLAENWVLIDLIDFASQCGVDLLEGVPE